MLPIKSQLNTLPPPPKGQTGMTLDQFSHLPPPPKGQQGLTLDQVQSQQTSQAPSYRFKDFMGNQKKILDTVPQQFQEIAGRVKSGQTGLGSGLLQGAGAAAEASSGLLGLGAKTLIPGFAKATEKIGSGISTTGNAITDIPAVQRLAASKPATALVNASEQHPDVLRNIQAGGNIANLALTPEAVTKTVDQVKGLANKVIDPVKEIYAQRKAANVQSAIDDLEQTYKDAATGRINLKKNLAKNEAVTQMKNNAGTEGKTAPRVLAEKGIVPETNKGYFSTRDQANNLRNDIAPLVETNKAGLREVQNSTPPVDLNTLEQSTIERLKSSGAVPEDIVSGANKIHKIYEAYRAKYGDTIDLTSLDAEKSARWGKTKFDTAVPQLDRDIHYNIAKEMQKTIENVADSAGHTEVAQLNRHIGDTLEASKFLESLDGRPLVGGKMGKHFIRLGGTIAGATHGPLGAIAGALGGEGITQVLQHYSVASPFVRSILKNLQTTDPEAYTATMKWIDQQQFDRAGRLMLPEKSGAPLITPHTSYESGAQNVGQGYQSKNTLPNANPTNTDIKNTIEGSIPQSNLFSKPDQILHTDLGGIRPKGGMSIKATGEVPVEQMSESAGGWQSGDKLKFDRALMNGDARTVKLMLPQVPKSYAQSFSSKIQNVLNKAKTKLGGSVALSQSRDTIGRFAGNKEIKIKPDHLKYMERFADKPKLTVADIKGAQDVAQYYGFKLPNTPARIRSFFKQIAESHGQKAFEKSLKL